MTDAPDARALLAAALDAYRAEVLPAVPAEQRYTALMVANALAVVQRELDGLEGARRAVMEAMTGLMGEDADPTLSDPALGQRLDALQRRLCADIAAGVHDGGGAELWACLEATVRARLTISNPKLLS